MQLESIPIPFQVEIIFNFIIICIGNIICSNTGNHTHEQTHDMTWNDDDDDDAM